MNYTTHHKLQKPLHTEKYDIGIHNTNADIIDSALNQLEQNNTSLNNTITNEIKRATERENEIDLKFSNLSTATDQLDGLMSSEDKQKLDEITTGTEQANKVWKTDADGNPAWRDDVNFSIETPVFDDSTSVYPTLNDAATAAETASNAIKSNTSIFVILSNMKKSFSAIVQGLKILAANVGSINGITSDINEDSENIAASIKVVNQLNSNIEKTELNGIERQLKICANTHLVTFDANGTAYINFPHAFTIAPFVIVNIMGTYPTNTGSDKTKLSVTVSTAANQQGYVKYIAIGY